MWGTRYVTAGLVLAGCMTGMVVQSGPAAAATSLNVTADYFGAAVHPGDTAEVDVTVEAGGDTATSGPVHVKLSADRGTVVSADPLGYPVDCTVVQGVAWCASQAPLGSSHVFELAVTVKVNGRAHACRRKHSVTTLSAVAWSPSDHVWGSASAPIPVTGRHG